MSAKTDQLAEKRKRIREWPVLANPNGIPGMFCQFIYKKIIRLDPCVYCGEPADPESTIDHIHPMHHGGKSWWTNYAPTCFTCNNGKHSQSLLEFMLQRMS